LTVRHLYALYPYENQLYTVETTGAVLRQALERSAAFFEQYPVALGTSLTNPRIYGYNFDIAGGVSYQIDLTRPVGERIVRLEFQGRPLTPDQKLRLAVNSYRYAGGGGYQMFRSEKIIRRERREIRELLIEYVRQAGRLESAVDNNWEIIPAAARQALFDSVQPRLAVSP
jgi:2',3'-cyclic-nucleotide 2'-phosphodiesterase/3'-nucleotidase